MTQLRIKNLLSQNQRFVLHSLPFIILYSPIPTSSLPQWTPTARAQQRPKFLRRLQPRTQQQRPRPLPPPRTCPRSSSGRQARWWQAVTAVAPACSPAAA